MPRQIMRGNIEIYALEAFKLILSIQKSLKQITIYSKRPSSVLRLRGLKKNCIAGG